MLLLPTRNSDNCRQSTGGARLVVVASVAGLLQGRISDGEERGVETFVENGRQAHVARRRAENAGQWG